MAKTITTGSARRTHCMPPCRQPIDLRFKLKRLRKQNRSRAFVHPSPMLRITSKKLTNPYANFSRKRKIKIKYLKGMHGINGILLRTSIKPSYLTTTEGNGHRKPRKRLLNLSEKAADWF